MRSNHGHRYRRGDVLVNRCMAALDPDEREIVDRIIALRTQGWTYQQIGAQLEAEGFNAKDPSGWQTQILRRLVKQRHH
jgi:hypothetical protein